MDPLEILFVREVIRTHIAALPAQVTGRELAPSLHTDHMSHNGQILYPLVDDERPVVGVITRGDLKRFAQDQPGGDGERRLVEMARRDPVVAYHDEPLRAVVHRMPETGLTRFPVLNNDTERKLAGKVSCRIPDRELTGPEAGSAFAYLLSQNTVHSPAGALFAYSFA